MSAVDDFEALVDDLVEAGVFAPSSADGLQPTEDFRRRREEFRSEAAALDEEAFEETLSTYAAEGATPADVDAGVLGDAMAIHAAADAVDRERSLLAAMALQRIETGEDQSGVPEGFVPIDGADVDGFMRGHRAAVIYFWKEDCPPCDGARENFEELLADGEIPDGMGLAAVFGPDAAELVREEYQVAVAPTTLFCVDGGIDSRIVGNPGYETFRKEIDVIAQALD